MSRLIDADALQSEYMRYHDGRRSVLIDVAPTIEPERKKGRWIHTRVNSEHSVTGYFLLSSCECSECKVICEQESNFCPNCGADMRRAKFDGEKGQS